MMSTRATFLLLILAGAVVLVSMSVFTVDEREYAIKFRFGEIVKADYGPGLHFKLPIVNTVRKFERRILTRNNPDEPFLTAEKKNLRVDFYVKWRIADPAEYFRTNAGDEARATGRLIEIIKDNLRAEFAKRTVQEVVTADRREVVKVDNAVRIARELGIAIVDVRVKALELPEDVSESVFQRMRQERAGVAADLRAKGAQTAEEIRSGADRERTVIVANARRESQQIRGDADAEAARIYAESYNRDREFYDFWRSLQAYRSSIGQGDDVLVIEPDGDFFRYLKDPLGGQQPR
jgi:membrane protease subunit HflC